MACGSSSSDDGWEVVEISVFPDAPEIHVGSETQLRVLGLDNNCDIYDYTDRSTYEAINPSIATVDADGRVTGVGTGTAMCRASTQGLEAMTTVEILGGQITGLTVDVPGEDLDDIAQDGVPVGDSIQARAVASFDDNVDDDVTTVATWSSDNETVATVDSEGLVSVHAAGIANIRADYQTEFDEIVVRGTTTGIVAIVIDGENEVAVNGTTQLSAFAIQANGDVDDITSKAIWTSLDRTIAILNQPGEVTGVGLGETQITAEFGGVTAVHDMAVLDALLERIQIERGYVPGGGPILSELEMEIGTSEYITAWGIYSDGTRRYVNATAVWWSSDQSVARINWLQSSTVFADDTGTATVAAYFGGRMASIEVTVVPTSGRVLQSIDIVKGFDPSPGAGISEITLRKDTFEYMTAWGNFSDGSREFITTQVTWRTGNRQVAYINGTLNTNLWGIAAGTTTCSASWQGVTEVISVTVLDGITPVLQSIEIQKNYCADGSCEVLDENNPLTIAVGQVQHITAWGNYTDGSKRYINTRVLWLSADNGIAAMDVLQRDSDVEGIAAGETEVVAILDGIVGRARVVVTE